MEGTYVVEKHDKGHLDIVFSITVPISFDIAFLPSMACILRLTPRNFIHASLIKSHLPTLKYLSAATSQSTSQSTCQTTLSTPTVPPAWKELTEIFHTKGTGWYWGLPVTQIEHALQCGTLAADANFSDDMIVACLLHDVGHLIQSKITCAETKKGDCHETVGSEYLSKWFPSSVTQPIALHCEAKRYMVYKDFTYTTKLSRGSRLSMDLTRGGHMTDEEAIAFEQQAYAKDSVTLRTLDEQACRPGTRTMAWSSFFPIINRVLQQASH